MAESIPTIHNVRIKSKITHYTKNHENVTFSGEKEINGEQLQDDSNVGLTDWKLL